MAGRKPFFLVFGRTWTSVAWVMLSLLFFLLLIPTHIQSGIEIMLLLGIVLSDDLFQYCWVVVEFMQSHPKLAQGGKFSLTVYLITGNRMKQRLHNLHMSMNHFYIYSFYDWERNETRLHNLIYTCPCTISRVTLPFVISFNGKNLPLGGTPVAGRSTYPRSWSFLSNVPRLKYTKTYPIPAGTFEDDFPFSKGEICWFPGGYHMHNIYMIQEVELKCFLLTECSCDCLPKWEHGFVLEKRVEKSYLLSSRSTNRFNVKYPCVVHSTNLQIWERWELLDCLGRAPY